MIRGFRGATTVTENDATEILRETKKLIVEMVQANSIQAEQISHVLFSVTDDLDDAFPAKAAREMDGWKHVPVMCMKEIDVPNSLPKCIRVMLVAKTRLNQAEVRHIFLNDAIKLRPDLVNEEGD
ncbi:MAG TPA: chorismate mutase [Pseudogracilibacillus sp.]|nr:chorismate mutase [Pseudogracilibacillus sp.]